MKKDDLAFLALGGLLAAQFIKLPFIGGGFLWAFIAYIAN